MKQLARGICAPKGFMAAGTFCGISKTIIKPDVALIWSENRCAAAGVYAGSRIKGAPVSVNIEHLQNGWAQAVICNSGIANTGGPYGMEMAEDICSFLADIGHIDAQDIIIASVGTTSKPFRVSPIRNALKSLVHSLGQEKGRDAAEAINGDRQSVQECAVSFSVQGQTCMLGGMAHVAVGSTYAKNDSPETVAFFTTDVAIVPGLLQQMLRQELPENFSSCVDTVGSTTNNMVTILANGLAGNMVIKEKNTDYGVVCTALRCAIGQLSNLPEKVKDNIAG